MTTKSSREFHVYSFEDYKDALQARIKDLRRTRPSLTAKWLASKVEIQDTYLSRCLNGIKTHLSEDHLYRLARHLDLLPDEIDYLLLLRSYSTTQDAHRKEMLFSKIDHIRKVRIGSFDKKDWNPEEFKNEVAYLFSPHCILIHVCLFIKDYQKNPRLICPHLGISLPRLKEILQVLDASQYITLAANDPFKVLEVKSKYPYFGREHPLMRAHQTTLKTALQARLAQTSEEEKESFIVTFTMDDDGLTAIRELFKEFVNSVQKVSFSGKHKHVYQLSFDLLKWL